MSAADFRAAMHRALRQTLSGAGADRPAVTGGLRERRLQLQQHIGALLERYPLEPASHLASASRTCRRISPASTRTRSVAEPRPARDVQPNEARIHGRSVELVHLRLPWAEAEAHIWRVHNRLDALQPAALRNYTGSFEREATRSPAHPNPYFQPRERDNGSTAADIRAADLRDLGLHSPIRMAGGCAYSLLSHLLR